MRYVERSTQHAHTLLGVKVFASQPHRMADAAVPPIQKKTGLGLHSLAF